MVSEIQASNEKPDKIIDKYLEISKRYNSPVTPSNNPFLEGSNGGVQIQTFAPTSCSTSNLNNHSIVTVISYAQSKMIIPGDCDSSYHQKAVELKNLQFYHCIHWQKARNRRKQQI